MNFLFSEYTWPDPNSSVSCHYLLRPSLILKYFKKSDLILNCKSIGEASAKNKLSVNSESMKSTERRAINLGFPLYYCGSHLTHCLTLILCPWLCSRTDAYVNVSCFRSKCLQTLQLLLSINCENSWQSYGTWGGRGERRKWEKRGRDKTKCLDDEISPMAASGPLLVSTVFSG